MQLMFFSDSILLSANSSAFMVLKDMGRSLYSLCSLLDAIITTSSIMCETFIESVSVSSAIMAVAGMAASNGRIRSLFICLLA